MKCPHCGGAIKWSATANSIRCEFCGTDFDAEALESYDVALEEDFQDEMAQGIAEGLANYFAASGT